MTESERIKEVRTALGLTLEKFGEKLGVTKVAISNIEKAHRNVTEQMRKSICREFNVDYIWLTTGEGEMFLDYSEDEEMFFAAIDTILRGENDRRKNLIKSLLKSSPEDIEALCRILDTYIELLNAAKEKPGD